MAEKQVWIGSVGPYLYDDADFPDGINCEGRITANEIVGGLNAHNTQHESGGFDEINVAGLSGELADAQPPKSHTHSSSDISDGWTGTFTNGDGDTVTVSNGIITDVSAP